MFYFLCIIIIGMMFVLIKISHVKQQVILVLL